MPANWDVVPDAWFVKLTLSLTIAFYLTKIEKFSSGTIALSKGTIFVKNMQKNLAGLGTKRCIF